MHMADALVSPAVGATLWAAAGVAGVYSVTKVKSDLDESRVPLMGVMGAFIFAAQMINFSIPGTGSSGHLGGGMLLTMLLGPYAGFLTIASVLVVQALFFADGGLLAMGCNIFNLGVFPCFIAYPLIVRPLMGAHTSRKRLTVASITGAVVALQLGAFAVVVQTVVSGLTDLSFGRFALLMQPIHLAIGVVEGLVTAAVVLFVWNARPELLAKRSTSSVPAGRFSVAGVITTLLIVALLTGGLLSWFASEHPDGLEWALERLGGEEVAATKETGVHQSLAEIQKTTSFLPDYGFPSGDEDSARAGTSMAGLVGSGITLLLAGAVALLFRRRRKTPEISYGAN
jgi:cobalt/nickel transport system permease protein